MTAHHHFDTNKNLVVYVDDDADDLCFVKEALTTYHPKLEVVTWESPAKAYQFFLQLEKIDKHPCLIILDINMPGISGKELASTVRSIDYFHQTPLILFSTSNSPVDAEYARTNGIGFITKPMNFEQMNQIAEQFLSHCSEEVKRTLR